MFAISVWLSDWVQMYLTYAIGSKQYWSPQVVIRLFLIMLFMQVTEWLPLFVDITLHIPHTI